ncbi:MULTISPECIES: helix-turn-helix transcriptional regulator [Tsukamurella]|uniref:Helix-turn-helix transcriptional regulator n=2 Tax=Tsukamurella TaxID=2060 RepID=A0A5C5S5X0_9ACTN|nr:MULTISPECIES: AraC family transcriptional regulator [Tsukamurella]NMD55009.1 helix-turn-helix transcriptional regulator [Tsukamurella columbiensis]TWS30043.1 helix-turn-helix transcriptional regulator [Tsukamurella conjunctivitidis]
MSGWTGSVHLGVGALAYDGPVGTTGRHRHAAWQLLALRSGTVTVTVWPPDGPPEVREGLSALVIPAGTEHAVGPVSPDATGLTVYLDPAAVPLALPETPTEADLRHLATARDGLRPVHPYVLSALDAVERRRSEAVSLTAVAAEIGVSASHLSRLWRRDLGLAFPAWVRWSRLRAMAERVRAGASITDAAHAAGFADGAHASRVCREMFGLSPQQLLAALG